MIMASPATRIDPFTVGRFLVNIDGVTTSAFSEVSGLEVSIEVVEYRQGNSAGLAEQKLPGLHRYSNLTLKRGFTADLSLWNWFNGIVNGNLVRKEIGIILLDAAENPVLSWRVHNAWPSRWTGPVLNAHTNDVAIESLEIVHEGIDLAPAS
jgi:phage tail-like protein